ncbi:MAG: F0F1 ATP synthase subunit B [Pseudomonadota bacterium]
MMARSLFLVLAAAPFAYAADESHGGGFVPEWLSHGDTNTAFLAMVVFLAIVWRVGGFRLITDALDNRAAAIKAQLEEAKDLREAAAKLLAEAERKQREADDEAAAIVDQAKKDAEVFRKEARKSLEQRLARREAIAEARIKQAETDAADEVRRAAADTATRAAQQILGAADGSEQFEAAASQIEKALN